MNGLDYFLVFSNLFFILPAIRALYKREWIRAIVFFLITFISGTYHLCDSSIMACLWETYIHHDLDFFLSQLLIPMTILYFIYFKYRFIETWILIIFAFAIYFVQVLTDSTQMNVQIIIVGISLGILLIYLVYHGIRFKRWPRYHAKSLIWGIIFTVAGVLFFVWDMGDAYWALHSSWHIFVAIGQYFLLGIKDAAPLYVNPRFNEEFDPKLIAKLKSRINYDVDGKWIHSVFPSKQELVQFMVKSESSGDTSLKYIREKIWNHIERKPEEFYGINTYKFKNKFTSIKV